MIHLIHVRNTIVIVLHVVHQSGHHGLLIHGGHGVDKVVIIVVGIVIVGVVEVVDIVEIKVGIGLASIAIADVTDVSIAVVVSSKHGHHGILLKEVIVRNIRRAPGDVVHVAVACIVDRAGIAIVGRGGGNGALTLMRETLSLLT